MMALALPDGTDMLLIAQGVASAAMCGIIWFVQAVHYPLFSRIREAADDFARENQQRTQGVVLPFMCVEAVAAAIIAWAPPAGVPRPLAIAGLAGIAVLWLSTLLVQVPLHARLAREGHCPAVVAALVRSNWVRTIVWTARALLAAWMLRVAG